MQKATNITELADLLLENLVRLNEKKITPEFADSFANSTGKVLKAYDLAQKEKVRIKDVKPIPFLSVPDKEK